MYQVILNNLLVLNIQANSYIEVINELKQADLTPISITQLR